MRFRTAAASAALVLCAATGAAACSSSSGGSESTRPAGPAAPSDPAPVEGMAGNIETGTRQAGQPQLEGQGVTDPAECAVPVDEIPASCALDLSFSGSSDGQPAAEPPDAR